MNTDRLRGKIQYKIWNKIGHISWTFERFFDQEWIIMSKKSKNVILTEKPKNFKKIRKHQKSQKTLFEPFWYHFWPFLVIWRQTKFTNVTRTPLHQKCQSQDIVQAGPPILFLVYFYDSYLQHIKSCQGKVGFENEGSYLLKVTRDRTHWFLTSTGQIRKMPVRVWPWSHFFLAIVFFVETYCWQVVQK